MWGRGCPPSQISSLQHIIPKTYGNLTRHDVGNLVQKQLDADIEEDNFWL
jgi:hypothetical protein